MELRDWLMAAGAVLILLILIDGWRRINGGSDKIRLKIDPSTVDSDSDTDQAEDKSNPELPNGGARVKRHIERPDIDALMAAEALQANASDTATNNAEPEPLDDPLADLRADNLDADPFVDLIDEGVVSQARKTSIEPSKPSTSVETSTLAEEPLDAVASVAQDHPQEADEGGLVSSETQTDSTDSVTTYDQAPVTPPTDINSADLSSLDEPLPAFNDATDFNSAVETDVDSSETRADGESAVSSMPLTTSVDDTLEADPRVTDNLTDPDPLLDNHVVETEQAPLTSEPDQKEPEESSKPLGHVDDLFGMDLDRPIHELVDAGAQSDKPVKKRQGSTKKKEKPRSEFDELLEPRSEESEPLQDIESLVSDLPDQSESSVSSESLVEEPAVSETDVGGSEGGEYPQKSEGRQLRELDLSNPETRLVVFVVAQKENRFSGAHIRTIIERCGMEFGQMNLFHRFEDNSDNSHIQFTMSNVGEPGSFDIELMDELSTPAVTFFMSMAEPRDPSYAVDCMLATAETLAKALQGEMLDNERSVMRPQTQEHYRELVKAYKLRTRAKSRRTRQSK